MRLIFLNSKRRGQKNIGKDMWENIEVKISIANVCTVVRRPKSPKKKTKFG